VIVVDGLIKEFDGRQVLRGISFGVGRGEVFGFLGPNGAGKTTTMRILLGLLRPTYGSATVMGEDMAENGDVRRKVGVLLERDGLYEGMTVRDNLDYYARLYSIGVQKVPELIELVGLRGHEGQLVGKLSKGMKRRAALARSLLNDPEVLFLDEPLAGLDPEAQRMFREAIVDHASNRGTTIFLNSHNLDEVQRMCNRIAILDQGRIRAIDTVSGLRELGHRLEVVPSTGRDLELAMRVMARSSHVLGTEVKGDRIIISMSSGSSARIITELVSAGVSVEEAIKASRNLEEAYLDMIHGGE
jgi:ABC-2 type transport system ATP-binding protein